MTLALEVEGFRKTFKVGFWRKPSEAARNISLRVEKGEVFGFLGPNGAGKTTTIKAILGLIRADGGKISVLGHPVDAMDWRYRIGYMPEHPTFYDFLTGLELVTWFGRLAGMNRTDAEKAADRQLDRVGLGHAKKRRIRGYSKGMVQRAGLAQALVASPDLLILDEPMTGLDPIGRREIRDLILSLKHEGKTVFYSTHILPDVEMTCDRVSIIQKGETKTQGRLKDILLQSTQGVLVTVTADNEAVMENLVDKHPEGEVHHGSLSIIFEDFEKARQFTADAQQSGAKLLRFVEHHDDLERIFMKSLAE